MSFQWHRRQAVIVLTVLLYSASANAEFIDRPLPGFETLADTFEAFAADSVGDATPTPGDPVIEEPLRPLLPDGATGGLLTAAACGPINVLPFTFGLLGLGALRIGGRRRFAGSST